MAQYKNFGTYKQENHNNKSKKLFEDVIGLLSSAEETNNTTVLDVGCATGALIKNLKTKYPSWQYHGIDISEELLALAREREPYCNFTQGSALELGKIYITSFDKIFCIGVIGVFDADAAKRLIQEIYGRLNDGGEAIVVGQFNKNDVDIEVRHRKVCDKLNNSWESGWSIYSQKTVKSWIKELGGTCEFTKFEPDFCIEPSKDPVRTWTTKVDGKTALVNGLNLLVELYFLKMIKQNKNGCNHGQ